MHFADLVFLACALATLVGAPLVLWRLVRGRRDAARRLAVGWGFGAAAYVAVLLVVSLVQPGRVVPLGQDECFDDWCIAAVAADRHDTRLVVTLRVSNRGRGRAQAEPDAFVYLRDETGRAIMPVTDAAIGEPVPAGQYRDVPATFDVPAGAHAFTLVKARRARLPGVVIIGDPTSLLHRPTEHALMK